MFKAADIESRKIKVFVFTVLLLAVAFIFVNFISISNANAGVRLKKAPNFNLKVLNVLSSGYTNFSLEKYRGHVIIINFWATWCPPCRHETPMLEKFYKTETAKGVIVVGINVNDNLSGVRSFIKLYGVTYPVVYADSGVIDSYGGIDEIPQTFFISKSGKIMFHWVGEIFKRALYGITNKLLNLK